MGFRTARISDRGGRKKNEDCADFALAGELGCWVVADGLGAHRGGEVASQLAVEKLLEAFRAHPEFSVAALTEYLNVAHQAVVSRQQLEPGLQGMRTTIVVLVSDGRAALWAHVGDSRLYHLRGGAVVFQTSDHSVPQTMADAGDIASEDIRHHEDRNRLLRTLGSPGPLRPTFVERPQQLRQDDAFLLCVDGFWELVPEAEMEIDLAKSRHADDWLRQMASRARQAIPPAQDNYTAIAVSFDGSRTAGYPRYAERRRFGRLGSVLFREAVLLVAGTLVALVLIGDIASRLYRRGDRTGRPASVKDLSPRSDAPKWGPAPGVSPSNTKRSGTDPELSGVVPTATGTLGTAPAAGSVARLNPKPSGRDPAPVSVASPNPEPSGGDRAPSEPRPRTGSLTLATPDARPNVSASCPDGMALIPAGQFLMGSREQDHGACSDEMPTRRVSLASFCLDVDEVTNAAYAKATSVKQPQQCTECPVVRIAWEDARNYCRAVGKRLPTEAEWERAARGDLEASRYPWGDAQPTTEHANFCGGPEKGVECQDEVPQLAKVKGIAGSAKSVGSYPANRFGLHDMAGNVWEWCDDWYDKDYYKSGPPEAPGGPSAGAARVVRGGAWDSKAALLRCANRWSMEPGMRVNNVGIRCAATPASRPQAFQDSRRER